jgi:hypothetical protein
LIITVAICAFGWCIWPTTPKASTPLSARQQKSQSSEKSQPPEKTVKNEPPTIKTVYVPVKSAAPTAYIAPTNQPTTVNNAPNGIAISGGVVTSPTVNNYAPPPGVLSSVAEQIDSHPGVYRVKLHITVRNSWHDAAFVVKCDRPCHGEGMPQRLPNQYLAGSNWDDAEHPDWTVAKIDLPNPLPDGTEFIWWISSKDGKPISVNTIQRAEIVAQPPQR